MADQASDMIAVAGYRTCGVAAIDAVSEGRESADQAADSTAAAGHRSCGVAVVDGDCVAIANQASDAAMA